MIFTLCACSLNRNDNSGKEAYVESYSQPVMYSAMADSAAGLSGFSANTAAARTYFEAPEAEMEAAEIMEPEPAPDEADAQDPDTGSDLDPEKIIYSADATVETTEFDKTLEAVKSVVEELGGWIESSSVNGAQYSNISRGAKTNRSANYTIRVPNGEFDGLMSRLPSLGNVPYSHIYTENVTSQYYDTKTRLTTYQAQEQRLLDLLDMAENVSDVIEIENELAEVRYRIESLQTTLRGWDRRVSWSTLYLNINEVSEYTPAEKRSYGSRLMDSLENGIDDLGEFLLELVEALPVLILLLILLIIVILIIKKTVRAGNRRRAERREKRNAADANPAVPDAGKTETE